MQQCAGIEALSGSQLHLLAAAVPVHARQCCAYVKHSSSQQHVTILVIAV